MMKYLIQSKNNFQRLVYVAMVCCGVWQCAEPTHTEPVVARVADRYYTLSELEADIPDGLDENDSLEMANNLIQNWMNRELLYEKAKFNLSEQQPDIEAQVEKYRKDLFIFAYEKEIVAQKLDTVVSAEEIRQFYNENQEIFQLNDYILKVRYAKLLPNSPDLDKLERAMKSNSPEDLALLEDYCHRYAVKCFYDSNWVYFNELLRELPIEVYNKESFLRTGNFLRFTDSEHLYLLYIADLQSKNTLSPLELEASRIRNLILNRRKLELLARVRRSLYRDAVSKSFAERYEEPIVPH